VPPINGGESFLNFIPLTGFLWVGGW